MKNSYVKPNFSLAPIALANSPSGACAADLETVADFFGIDANELKDPSAFAQSEGCVKAFDIDYFCKFSSVSFTGSTSVFGS
ncbi:MAG: hypothetical protein Q4C21_04070 [Oscillospiraceae bacterium]|nr:hypothetical protein [Oscillospiraceae bacterium]MDO4397569.1 hypothetical protein [Oscillospiraceae bacterium]